jgi:hypothetical protein
MFLGPTHRRRAGWVLGMNGKLLQNQQHIRLPRVAAFPWRRIEGCTVNCRAKPPEPVEGRNPGKSILSRTIGEERSAIADVTDLSPNAQVFVSRRRRSSNSAGSASSQTLEVAPGARRQPLTAPGGALFEVALFG